MYAVIGGVESGNQACFRLDAVLELSFGIKCEGMEVATFESVFIAVL